MGELCGLFLGQAMFPLPHETVDGLLTRLYESAVSESYKQRLVERELQAALRGDGVVRRGRTPRTPQLKRPRPVPRVPPAPATRFSTCETAGTCRRRLDASLPAAITHPLVLGQLARHAARAIDAPMPRIHLAASQAPKSRARGLVCFPPQGFDPDPLVLVVLKVLPCAWSLRAAQRAHARPPRRQQSRSC